MGLTGALWIEGVDDVTAYEPGQTLDVPGQGARARADDARAAAIT